jgi:NADH-quinone oxidoreductase subunit E
MSVRKLRDESNTPFEFNAQNKAWLEKQIAKYPAGRQQSAVIPALWRAQKQHGWVSRGVIEHIACILGMAAIRVYEVATFYTMFNLAPVGRYFVQVCGTTPCMLRGSDDILAVCKSRIAAHENEVRGDGLFSWLEVECLGACANAPMVQINDDYYEDLTAENFNALLDAFERGETPVAGSQIGRRASEPEGTPVPAPSQFSVSHNGTVALALTDHNDAQGG